MKVTLLQTDVVFGKPEVNFSNIEVKLEGIGGELVVLPELFLTGYHPESIHQSAFSGGKGGALDWITRLSLKEGIAIYGSIAELDDGKYYNTGILVNKGTLVSKYRKSHLFGPMGEKDIFAHGRDIVTTELQGHKLGLSICYDLRFPEIYQRLASRNSEILLVSAEWPNTRISHWVALARARAIENQIFVIAVNRVGTDPEYTYGGNSVIFDPYGEAICRLSDKEETCTKEIDLSVVQRFKSQFDVRSDKWIH